MYYLEVTNELPLETFEMILYNGILRSKYQFLCPLSRNTVIAEK